MPAGPTLAPGAIPAGLLFRRWLPQHEVRGIALIGRHVNPGARDQLILVTPGENTVVGHGRGIEQDVSIGGIGMALGDQRLGHGDHAVHIFRGPGLVIRGQGIQGRHVVMENLRSLRRHFGDALPTRLRPIHDLIINVSDISHIDNGGIAAAQQAHKTIEDYYRPGIAYMGKVINRGATDI